jgi:hypothetical protein
MLAVARRVGEEPLDGERLTISSSTAPRMRSTGSLESASPPGEPPSPPRRLSRRSHSQHQRDAEPPRGGVTANAEDTLGERATRRHLRELPHHQRRGFFSNGLAGSTTYRTPSTTLAST